MTFVYPSFLWALFAIAIPIIIHFFNFRTHKTVYFSNVAFLQNIEQETKSRNRIKDLLILLMRILTIIALVFAFAKPVKYNDNKIVTDKCGNNFGIYIDNSFSMTTSDGEAANIDNAKSLATDVVSSFSQSANYLFLTNEISSEQQHFYIKDIAQNFISQTNISPIFRKTSFVIDKFRNLFNSLTPDCNNNLFIISDFQKNTFDPDNFNFDTNTNVFLLPVIPYETSNLFIDSVWFLSPYHLSNASDSITVRIKNNSDLDFTNQQIKLFINDTLKTLSTFNISAHEELDFKLIFTNTELGFIQAKVSIDDYPITFDNDLYFSYYIAPKVNILLVEGKTQPYLQNFYADDKYFDLHVVSEDELQISEIFDYQAVIFASVNDFSSGFTSELKNYAQNGGIITIIPNLNADFTTLNLALLDFDLPQFLVVDTVNYLVKNIDLQSYIYKDAFENIRQNSDFPVVYEHLKFKPSTFSNYNGMLKLENNDELLVSKDIGDGTVYLFTSEMLPQSGNFMLNPVSVPTFYNIPVFKKDNNQIYQTIGNTQNIQINNLNDFEVVKFQNINSQVEFFPQVTKISQSSLKINLSDFNSEAGNYRILNQDDAIGMLSINYTRKEANLDYYTIDELQQIIKKYNLKNWQIFGSSGEILQNQLQTNLQGKNLWKIFIILALFFILAEIILIRLLKK